MKIFKMKRVDPKLEIVKKNSENIIQQETDKGDTLHSEVTKGVFSESTMGEMQEVKDHSMQKQENLETLLNRYR